MKEIFGYPFSREIFTYMYNIYYTHVQYMCKNIPFSIFNCDYSGFHDLRNKPSFNLVLLSYIYKDKDELFYFILSIIKIWILILLSRYLKELIKTNKGNKAMKEVKHNFIILSAEQKGLTTKENRYETAKLRAILSTFNYLDCEGSYKGEKETSFLVSFNDIDNIKWLKNLAFYDFKQESVLIRNGENVFLLFNDNTKEVFKGFKRVNESEAFKCIGYTKNINGYFILTR